MVIAATDRAHLNTPPGINEKIQCETEQRIAHYRANPSEIGQRLAELGKEWDIERALETASSLLSLLGLTLGIIRKRRWLLLPLAAQGLLLQHAVQGWCPPGAVLRRLGFRTRHEIEYERAELEKLRGGNSPS